MSWVKLKNSKGNIFTVPKYFYETMYKNYNSFSIVKDEPKVGIKNINNIEKENVNNNEKIQRYKEVKNRTPNKDN